MRPKDWLGFKHAKVNVMSNTGNHDLHQNFWRTHSISSCLNRWRKSLRVAGLNSTSRGKFRQISFGIYSSNLIVLYIDIVKRLTYWGRWVLSRKTGFYTPPDIQSGYYYIVWRLRRPRWDIHLNEATRKVKRSKVVHFLSSFHPNEILIAVGKYIGSLFSSRNILSIFIEKISNLSAMPKGTIVRFKCFCALKKFIPYS